MQLSAVKEIGIDILSPNSSKTYKFVVTDTGISDLKLIYILSFFLANDNSFPSKN